MMKLVGLGKKDLMEKRKDKRDVSSLDLEGYTFLKVDQFRKKAGKKKDYVKELMKLIEGLEEQGALYLEVENGKKTKKIYYTVINTEGNKKVVFN